MFRRLDVQEIVKTTERLVERIVNRFPESGLAGVGKELVEVGREAQYRASALAEPIYPLRIAVWLVIVIFAIVPFVMLATLNLSTGFETLGDFIQTLEAGVNDLVFVAVGIFFLVTLEGRIKRRRALLAIRDLRSIAHIIDMHQLTKDPELVLSGAAGSTLSAPMLSRFELAKYLDYCSEMLSLSSKIAALYVQHFDDRVVLEAVNEVEGLTTGLSRKVWQKIMILDTVSARTAQASDA
jgi:hypothetical protein